MIEFNAEIYRKGITEKLYIETGKAQEFLSMAIEKWGKVGVRLMRPISNKTLQQHKAIEAIINEWYRSGQHNAPEGLSLPLFRYWVKCEYGALVGYHPEIGKIPKSLGKYTKQEMMDFIDLVKSDILQTMRPLTPKMQEIFLGMEI